MESQDIQQILFSLEHWLHQAEEAEGTGTHTECPEVPDLFTVFQEQAELKTEMRNAARQNNKALESLQEDRRYLLDQIQELKGRLEQTQEQVVRTERKSVRSLLLSFLDVHDRLRAAVNFSFQKPWWNLMTIFRVKSSNSQWLTGSQMTLSRMDELLRQYDVRPIMLADAMLDPEIMRVIAVELDMSQKDGVVLREVRRGFLWHDEVLRVADVVVNRRNI